MKKLMIALALLLLVGCQATPETVEVTRLVDNEVTVEVPVTKEVTRIVAEEVTRLVEVEVTRLVEVAITATPQPTPRPTNTPTTTLEEARQEFTDALISGLEEFDDVERVDTVTYDAGRMTVELTTLWATQDSQPDVSWDIVVAMAEVFSDLSQDALNNLAGGEFVFVLITRSTLGNYRYQSETTAPMLQAIHSRQMGRDEWEEAANAGFR